MNLGTCIYVHHVSKCMSYHETIVGFKINRRTHCLYFWLHIYYAHLTFVRFEHFVWHESLLRSFSYTYIYVLYIYFILIYIYTYIYMYIYIYIYIFLHAYRYIYHFSVKKIIFARFQFFSLFFKQFCNYSTHNMSYFFIEWKVVLEILSSRFLRLLKNLNST